MSLHNWVESYRTKIYLTNITERSGVVVIIIGKIEFKKNISRN
jgi:hypothetical protein